MNILKKKLDDTKTFKICSLIDDNSYDLRDGCFNILFTKFNRLHNILEPWNFGLYVQVGEIKYWICLEHDKNSIFEKYSKILSNSTNESAVPILNYGIITYPLNLKTEIWSENAVSLFYDDIKKSQPPKCLSEEDEAQLKEIESKIEEVNEHKERDVFSNVRIWKLKKEYIGIIGDMDKITWNYGSPSSQTRVSMTNKHLIINSKEREAEKIVIAAKNEEIRKITEQRDNLKKELKKIRNDINLRKSEEVERATSILRKEIENSKFEMEKLKNERKNDLEKNKRPSCDMMDNRELKDRRKSLNKQLEPEIIELKPLGDTAVKQRHKSNRRRAIEGGPMNVILRACCVLV